jgi:hypothetical protein
MKDPRVKKIIKKIFDEKYFFISPLFFMMIFQRIFQQLIITMRENFHRVLITTPTRPRRHCVIMEVTKWCISCRKNISMNIYCILYFRPYTHLTLSRTVWTHEMRQIYALAQSTPSKLKWLCSPSIDTLSTRTADTPLFLGYQGQYDPQKGKMWIYIWTVTHSFPSVSSS